MLLVQCFQELESLDVEDDFGRESVFFHGGEAVDIVFGLLVAATQNELFKVTHAKVNATFTPKAAQAKSNPSNELACVCVYIYISHIIE